MSLNETKDGSELWYAVVSRSGNRLSLSAPERVAAMVGTNRSPALVRLNDAEAELLWIHEGRDGGNMEVLRSTWTGSNWQEPVVLAETERGVTFDELAADGRDGTGLAAWTESRYFENGRYDAGLSSALRDPMTGVWNVERVTSWDSTVTFGNPAVSLSEDRQSVISYQVVPRAIDSLNPNNGRRFLGLRDLTDPSLSWKTVPGLDFLSDTTSFVWDAETGFGPDGTLYVLTEEHGFSSEGGVPFGDSRLGLQLRAVRLTSSLDVLDADEPITPTSGISEPEQERSLQISAMPNPATTEVILSYRVERTRHVRLEVCDLLGRNVQVLLDETLEAGLYRTTCNLARLGSGIYVIRLTTEEGEVHKLLRVIQ